MPGFHGTIGGVLPPVHGACEAFQVFTHAGPQPPVVAAEALGTHARPTTVMALITTDCIRPNPRPSRSPPASIIRNFGRSVRADRSLDEGASYTELSVERLAEAAGISRSGFYTYFPDKIALLEELTAELNTEISDAGIRVWALPDDADSDAVGAAIQRFFEAYRPHAALFDAIIETTAYDPGIRAQYEAMISESAERLVAHIRDGQSNGTITPTLHPERTAMWIAWMAERGLQQIVRKSPDDELADQADALAEIVWQTLYEGQRRR